MLLITLSLCETDPALQHTEDKRKLCQRLCGTPEKGTAYEPQQTLLDISVPSHDFFPFLSPQRASKNLPQDFLNSFSLIKTKAKYSSVIPQARLGGCDEVAEPLASL